MLPELFNNRNLRARYMNLLEKAMLQKTLRESQAARPNNDQLSGFKASALTIPATNIALPRLSNAGWIIVALATATIAILFTSAKKSSPAATPAPQIATAKQTVPVNSEPVGTDKNHPSVEAFVASWVKAWSTQDVEKYLSAYAPDFLPPHGLALPDWKTQRRHRLTKYRKIEIALTGLTVSVEKDTATVEFTQSFKGDNFYESGLRKRLDLRLKDSHWMITRESAVRLT